MDILSTSSEIAIMQMPLDIIVDKSTLVQW